MIKIIMHGMNILEFTTIFRAIMDFNRILVSGGKQNYYVSYTGTENLDTTKLKGRWLLDMPSWYSFHGFVEIERPQALRDSIKELRDQNLNSSWKFEIKIQRTDVNTKFLRDFFLSISTETKGTIGICYPVQKENHTKPSLLKRRGINMSNSVFSELITHALRRRKQRLIYDLDYLKMTPTSLNDVFLSECMTTMFLMISKHPDILHNCPIQGRTTEHIDRLQQFSTEKMFTASLNQLEKRGGD